MAAGESAEEMIIKVLPTRQIVDLSLFDDGQLSTKEGFKSVVQNLCGDEKLPLVFPLLPDYFKASINGFVINKEYRDKQLSLPAKLLDGRTYMSNLELRGPMEEIILGYEKERLKHGLPPLKIWAEGFWSSSFIKRFEKVNKILDLTPEETKIELEEANRRLDETFRRRLKNEGKVN